MSPEELARLTASVPVRTVTEAEPRPESQVFVTRPSLPEIRAAMPELADLGRRFAAIEQLLSESKDERLRRVARDESERELKRMRAVELERMFKNIGKLTAASAALFAAIGGAVVQIIKAWKGSP